MNNNFQNEKSKKDKMKKIYFGVGVVVLMGMCFSLSYLITDWITNPKYDAFIEDRTVYNSTDVLEDTTTIALISGDNIDKEQSLKEFKEENNIQVDVNQQFLIDFLDDSGYKLEALDNNKIVFKKENSENILVANKYYLGEKDGYFAIYKTDENGRGGLGDAHHQRVLDYQTNSGGNQKSKGERLIHPIASGSVRSSSCNCINVRSSQRPNLVPTCGICAVTTNPSDWWRCSEA